jgi:hypothetical protein
MVIFFGEIQLLFVNVPLVASEIPIYILSYVILYPHFFPVKSQFLIHCSSFSPNP